MPKLFGTDIKSIVAKNVGKGLPLVTFTSVVPGTRTPGSLTAGTQPVETDYEGRGMVGTYSDHHVANTSVKASDRKILLIWGTFLSSAPDPKPGDKILAEGITYVIVKDGVSRDPASATFTCQCRK